jgi:regulator of nucleoside diphosphate kinase
MPLVQVGSFADSRSRSDNSRILSETDIARLKRGGYLITASAQQRALLEELEAMAVFVDSADVPPDVITLNTTLECVDVGGDVYRWTLVYPDEADYQQGRISVLSPAGIALLGARCGYIVDCRAPSGSLTRYLISRIVQQPESSRTTD